MLKYRIVYGLVLAASLIFYLFYTAYLSFFTLIAVLLLPALSLIFTLLSAAKTGVRFEVKNPCAGKEEVVTLDIIFQNRSVFPIAQAWLLFSCTNALSGETMREAFYIAINSGAEQTAEYELKSQYCGKLTIQLEQIKFYDHFGIFRIKRRFGTATEVFVLPKSYPLDTGIDTTVNYDEESTTFSKEKPGSDSSELFDIRPYREGDPLRSIHWKLSSKLDELMVKEFSLPMDDSVLLLTELMARDMETLDTVLEAMVSLCNYLLENRINYRVEWYNAVSSSFEKAEIKTVDTMAELINAMLSSRRYSDEPYALSGRLTPREGEFPHAIYITGQLTERLTAFGDRPNGDKTTVVCCGAMDETEKGIATSLESANVPVVTILPNRIQEGLSGLML